MDLELLRPYARKLLRSYEVRGSRSPDLAAALSGGEPASWSGGQRICGQGEGSDVMFVVLVGGIRVLRAGFDGLERELAVLAPPCLIGHMGMVDGSARSASCEAVGHVGGLVFGKNAFNRLMSEPSPGASAFRQLVLAAMMSQLSSTNRKIRELMTPPPGLGEPALGGFPAQA